LKTGKRLWIFAANDAVDASPVIGNGRAAIASKNGWVYLLDLSSGEEISSFEVGAPVSASPAAAPGRIIVAAEDGGIYSLGEES
jgi:outer membrane protein assembly factor BamB